MKSVLIALFLITIMILPTEVYSVDAKTSGQGGEYFKADRKKNPSNAYMRERFFNDQRAYPYDEIPRTAVQDAERSLAGMLRSNKSGNMLLAQQPEWKEIGPFSVGGRVRSVVVHPQDDNVVYIGAAAGGVWKTTDGGGHWVPIFDFETSIAFGAIAIDNNNPDVLYAATGEMSSNIDAYNGAGVFKTTDAGETWLLVGLSDVATFSKIYVHPQNSDIVYAGACKSNHGFYRSTDAGANWVKTDNFENDVTDVSIFPENPDEIIIGVNGKGVFYSSDGGVTFQNRSSGFPSGIGRVSVQISPSNPDVIYCLSVVDSYGAIYKSNNRGVSWSVSQQATAAIFGSNNQGFYDNYIQTHPRDDQIAFAGGIDIWRTTNGGSSWTNITNSYSGSAQLHPDQHHAAFGKMNPNTVYAAHDGGMSKSINGGRDWNTINTDLSITQFYGMAVDHSADQKNYGGTQDNGTLGNRYNPEKWNAIVGGDGFKVMVDYDNPHIVYGENPNGALWKQNSKTNKTQTITYGISSADEGYWSSPMAMNRFDSELLYHGRHAMYLSYDAGAFWFPVTQQFSEQFTSIGVSPLNEELVFAGSQTGDLYVSIEYGDEETWVNKAVNGLPGRFVTDIEGGTDDDEVIYVTFSGYGSQHIYKTVDLGETWNSLSDGLPDVPFNAIAIHPDNPEWLFAASDIGVFASFNDGESWLPYGRNLPGTPIIDMEFHTQPVVEGEYTLRVATHGRSMWEINVPNDVIDEAEITSPGGAEILTGGSKYPVSWYGFKTNVNIAFSSDDGQTWSDLATNVSGTKYMMKIPNRDYMKARVKVSSEDGSTVRISDQFTTNQMKIGSILQSQALGHIAYGIALDGNGDLWTTSYYTNQLFRLNKDNLKVDKILTIPGDSLFTGLTIDKTTNTFYVHRLRNSSGVGGFIMEIDKDGNLIKEYSSPAKEYPVGITLVGDRMWVADRDGSRWLYLIKPESYPETKFEIEKIGNPYAEYYGPRGLCFDGEETVYQACTKFSVGGGGLIETAIIKLNKDNMTTILDTINLTSRNGAINCRGIEYDSRDKNFWISDFTGSKGSIYKIAGFSTITDVEDQELNELLPLTDVEVYPNPVKDVAIVSFSAPMKTTTVTIDLYNLVGVKLKTVYAGNIGGGSIKTFNFDAAGLTPGMYNLMIRADGNCLFTKKITVVR